MRLMVIWFAAWHLELHFPPVVPRAGRGRPAAVRRARGRSASPSAWNSIRFATSWPRTSKGTVTAVAKMGYEVVEFFAPYFSWTHGPGQGCAQADGRSGHPLQLHAQRPRASPATASHKAIELNSIAGRANIVVMASAGRVDPGLDGWKTVARRITAAWRNSAPPGCAPAITITRRSSQPLDGKRPIEVIAANTPKDVMLQLDVGTCVEVGSDPVAWINANPGRINCLHLKDWAPGEQDEGLPACCSAKARRPWKQIFAAAENRGRRGVLPDRAGRQPLPGAGDGREVPGVL